MYDRQERGIFHTGSGLETREEIGLVNEIGWVLKTKEVGGTSLKQILFIRMVCDKPEMTTDLNLQMRSNGSLCEHWLHSPILLIIGFYSFKKEATNNFLNKIHTNERCCGKICLKLYL